LLQKSISLEYGPFVTINDKAYNILNWVERIAFEKALQGLSGKVITVKGRLIFFRYIDGYIDGYINVVEIRS